MVANVILMVGLGALFLAVFVGVVTFSFGSTGRTGVAAALSTIDRVYAPGAVTRDDSLRDRTRPTGRAIARVAKLLTPSGATAWMQKWLDYAGNPAAWPVERIMAMQGTGLVVFAILFGAVTALIAGPLATI